LQIKMMLGKEQVAITSWLSVMKAILISQIISLVICSICLKWKMCVVLCCYGNW